MDTGICSVLRIVKNRSSFGGFETMKSDKDKISEAIDLAVQYGGTDGSHHKAWVIDQMVRILAGNEYDLIVAGAKTGEDGPDTYEWDEGIAP